MRPKSNPRHLPIRNISRGVKFQNKNRRLHSTGLTNNLTKPNNHPNSALITSILNASKDRGPYYAFFPQKRQNARFCLQKSHISAFEYQCFKSNRAIHPQSNDTTSFANRPDFHELPSDWTIIIGMANSSNGPHPGRVHHIANWPCLQFLIGMYPTQWRPLLLFAMMMIVQSEGSSWKSGLVANACVLGLTFPPNPGTVVPPRKPNKSTARQMTPFQKLLSN